MQALPGYSGFSGENDALGFVLRRWNGQGIPYHAGRCVIVAGAGVGRGRQRSGGCLCWAGRKPRSARDWDSTIRAYRAHCAKCQNWQNSQSRKLAGAEPRRRSGRRRGYPTNWQSFSRRRELSTLEATRRNDTRSSPCPLDAGCGRGMMWLVRSRGLSGAFRFGPNRLDTRNPRLLTKALRSFRVSLFVGGAKWRRSRTC